MQHEETDFLLIAAIGIAFFVFMGRRASSYIGPYGQPIVPSYMSGMSAAQQWQYQLQLQQAQQQNQIENTRFQQAGGVINNLMEKIWPTPKPPVQSMPMPQDDVMVGQVGPGLDGVTYGGVYYPTP